MHNFERSQVSSPTLWTFELCFKMVKQIDISVLFLSSLWEKTVAVALLLLISDIALSAARGRRSHTYIYKCVLRNPDAARRLIN
jgi:hypothetical protein